jgi:hypothetical protein
MNLPRRQFLYIAAGVAAIEQAIATMLSTTDSLDMIARAYVIERLNR